MLLRVCYLPEREKHFTVFIGIKRPVLERTLLHWSQKRELDIWPGIEPDHNLILYRHYLAV